MIRDTNLIYQLMSNVFNSMLDLARNSDNRDRWWRTRCNWHCRQIGEYIEMLQRLDVWLQICLNPDKEPYELLEVDVSMNEGSTNMYLKLAQKSQRPIIVRMRDVESISVIPSLSVPSLEHFSA